MITLFDYLPSQNAWKVRQLLRHLAIPYRTELVSIFEGQGQSPAFTAINPWGAVPAVRFEDGRVLSESNAILFYFGKNTQYVPSDLYGEAKVLQWLSFEADYVQSSLGSLRYWTLTGKLPARSSELLASKVATAEKALEVLNLHLMSRPFICGNDYTVSDISLFAYAHLASDAGLSTSHLVAFEGWVERVRAQPGHLSMIYPYSIDPHSDSELP